MRMSDVVPAVLVLTLSTLALIGSWDLGYWRETTPGPAFLPFWLAAAGASLFVLRLAEVWRDGSASGVAWPDRSTLIRVSMTFGGLVAIPILAPVLGMVPSIVLFMTFLLLVVLRRSLLPSLATVAVTGALIHAIFVWWLRVPLPVGALGI
jgi:hypothetical protein